MRCTKCNHPIPDDSEFCQYCGAKIEHIPTPAPPPKRKKTLVIVLSSLCILLAAVNIGQYVSYRNSSNNLETEIADLEAKITDLKKISNNYNLIISKSRGKKFGYASNNFMADTGVIIVRKTSRYYKFTLTADWSGGGTVNIRYSSSAAYISFDNDEWTNSTTASVIPRHEGVCVATFSNDVDENTFSVLIIVTD